MEDPTETVDPVVRAHVTSLVSALGGPDHTLPSQPYVLGDDALACLKDLKRWLKAYDQKLNRLEVARTIASTSLVVEDIPQILANWDVAAGNGPSRLDRVALSCVELLVHLTWPLGNDGIQNTVDMKEQKSHIDRAQRYYKSAILNHQSHRVLKAIARISLPPLAMKRVERMPRDDSVIKVVLYFFRNLVMIDGERTENEDDSRSLTIVEFEKQNIFELLLLLASGAGDNYTTLNIFVLEVVFYLIRGISVKEIYQMSKQVDSKPDVAAKDNASSWRVLETGKKLHTISNTSRHNRFGTMLSLVTDKRRLTISGQQALQKEASAIDVLDSTKTWSRPQGGRKNFEPDELASTIHITKESRKILIEFVHNFLDAAFNPLLISVRKDIERESTNIDELHKRQFLYLVSWFLEAEMERRRTFGNDYGKPNFGLIAGVLDQQSMITVVKLMRLSMENKDFINLRCAMDCFTNMILVISEMSLSEYEEDRDIADNMISRIFYEGTTLDLIVSIPNVVKDFSLLHLRSATQLIYVVLKLLENYSKQNKSIYVRKRRRRGGPRKRQRTVASEAIPNFNDSDHEEGSADEDDLDPDEAEILDTDGQDETHQEFFQASERAFEFKKFENRFITQNCVDLFRNFLVHFKDLTDQQIRLTFSFFHRIFFKREEELILYRIDFMLVLYRCLDLNNGIPLTRPSRREAENFMKHYMRKLVHALEDRQALFTELMFTKMPDSFFFLKYGYDKEAYNTKRISRDVHG
ncbi:timeless protein-domain-containing protein [Lipomyces japonicus]|uniref:timeless protein-domain-containing protein n=1 Tax=Lipomyces japonicus TaxID=56871 RepID=UPI0034CEB41D